MTFYYIGQLAGSQQLIGYQVVNGKWSVMPPTGDNPD